ncbi:MAG: class I SAM-dependent methyltransferase [Chitinophagales bacterium]
MNPYNKYILPKMIDWACQLKPNMRQREKIIPLATGKVLEIGVDSGLNLPYYKSSKIQHLTAIDPSVETWNRNLVDLQELPFQTEFIKAYAEDIPADNHSFDTIVFTYTLCSIPNMNEAFDEIKRVLKPNGKIVFCEHGKAPDLAVQKWQNRINPLWKRIGGGCNLNRDIPLAFADNGFRMKSLESMYLPGAKVLGFNYWGVAEVK